MKGADPVSWRARAVAVIATAVGMGPACIEFNIRGEDEEVVVPVVVTENFVQVPLPSTDILWVVDNTPSMGEEQAALSDAMAAFGATLDEAGIAWQVGVVTTDVGGDDAGVLQGNPWIMTPDLDDPVGALQDAAEVGTDGSEPAAGLGAAWLALGEPLASTLNRGFRRPDAALHVIVFSDGDDHSEIVLGSDPAGTFLELCEAASAASGQAAMVSAIVGDRTLGCAGPGGTAVPGDTYLDVVEATGGSSASICESDFGEVLDALASASVTWPESFPLQGVPVEDSVRVEVDGSRLDEGWTLVLDPPAVVFDSPPAPGAEIGVRYEIAE